MPLRGSLAVVLPIAEILSRNPPTIAECWAQHRHAAEVWRPKPPPPPPKPSKPAEPQLVWTGEGRAQVVAPAVVPAAPEPNTGAVWLYRLSLAYDAVHTVLHAAILLMVWITSSFPGTLIAAGLIALLWWLL